MATKGVWQLKQVTIRYCQHGGSSRYVRQLLSDERFVKFVEENPQVQFETELKGARHPVLIGDYGAYYCIGVITCSWEVKRVLIGWVGMVHCSHK